uniref:Secreted protein n=1 Tax=Syphacia muris TaxID=451379 RepID=A0A0N5AZ41_9BILA
MQSVITKCLIILVILLALAKLSEPCGYVLTLVSKTDKPFYAEVKTPATKQEFDWYYFKKKNTQASFKVHAPNKKCGEKKTFIRLYQKKGDKYKLVAQKSTYLASKNGTITVEVTNSFNKKFNIEWTGRRNVIRSDFVKILNI